MDCWALDPLDLALDCGHSDTSYESNDVIQASQEPGSGAEHMCETRDGKVGSRLMGS